MFTRRVVFRLRADSSAEFTRIVEGDDVGLPESPIYSNFTKHLWRAHTRHGLVQSPHRSGESTSGHRPPRGERLRDVRSPETGRGVTRE